MKNISKILGFFLILFAGGFSTFAAATTETHRCGLESCHGVNLKCGFNPPDMCTQVYMIGDFCRQYANCELSGETCNLIKNSKLDKCIDCVNACPKKNPLTQAGCEAKCRSKIEKPAK